jgi:hypothetical protein
MNLIVHHLRFTLRAMTLIHLGPQAGAQIRGALWAALQQFACTAPAIEGDPDHSQHCPMCRLMALETAEDVRGVNPPRPFAVRPPLTVRIESDQLFSWMIRFLLALTCLAMSSTFFPTSVRRFTVWVT